MKTIKPIFGRLIAGCVLTLTLITNVYGQDINPPTGGTNDPPTQEQIEAAYQAWLAQLATNRLSVLEYLHAPLALPGGSPWTADSAASYQQEQLLLLAEENQTAFDAAHIQVTNWSASTGEPVVSSGPDDRTITLIGFQYDMPILIMADDIFQADTISTDEIWPGGGSGLSLTGTNTIVGLWDESAVRRTHIEFATGSRVTQRDGATIQTRHSTGVAGVLAAAGAATLTINGTNSAQAAKGMSFQAQVYAHDADQDMIEMPLEIASNSFRLSNHSYGPASDGSIMHRATFGGGQESRI